MVEHTFKKYDGDLAHQPGVHVHQGDGRSYLARQDGKYDLIWFVAPDSYAANNAASSGAFVLSESYLYTTEMIKESLEHLTDRGVMVVQFGELDYRGAPNRTGAVRDDRAQGVPRARREGPRRAHDRVAVHHERER